MSTDENLTREGKPRQRHRFAVPSTWIAAKTGYSRTGIYRMRVAGDRDTSINRDRMTRMEKAFGWSKEDQFAALDKGTWAAEFEKVVTAAYAEENQS